MSKSSEIEEQAIPFSGKLNSLLRSFCRPYVGNVIDTSTSSIAIGDDARQRASYHADEHEQPHGMTFLAFGMESPLKLLENL